MQGLQGFFFLALVAVLVVLVMGWHARRSNALLHLWAEQNQYRILRQQCRRLFKGPYSWTSSKGQAVYYVVVEDSDGHKRSGWVRCGSWWAGLLSDHVEARWED